MYKLLVFLVATALLSGCASTDIRHISGSNDPHLNKQESVYVAIPKGPTSGDYQSAGQYIATALSSKLVNRGVKVTMAYKPESVGVNISTAQSAGAGYLFVPVLTNWEHNSTQWTFNPSTMGVRVEIFDARTGKELRVDSLTSESSHISFFGTDPKELLDEALDDYLDELYPDAQ